MEVKAAPAGGPSPSRCLLWQSVGDGVQVVPGDVRIKREEAAGYVGDAVPVLRDVRLLSLARIEFHTEQLGLLPAYDTP